MTEDHRLAAALIAVSIVTAWVTPPAPAGKVDTNPDAKEEAPRKARFDPVIKHIEGWTVHVDPKLLEGEHAEEGAR